MASAHLEGAVAGACALHVMVGAAEAAVVVPVVATEPVVQPTLVE